MAREMTGEDVIKNMVFLSIEGAKKVRRLREPNEIDFARAIVGDLFGALEPDDREDMLMRLTHRDEALRQASRS